jgi:lipoyl(octanoyl) transferase
VSELWVTTLGEVPYRDAVALQERLRDARQADAIPDTLLLLEHPPVYTRGRRAEHGDLPFGEDWYRKRGIEVADSDRGGQVTYHGPGQLVGYPIMRIESVRDYVATMERAIVSALAEEGVPARVREGMPGVWVQAGGAQPDRRSGEHRTDAFAKVASIGVHVSRGVTTHGFAVNVDNDLEPFVWIRPCGMESATFTSVSREKDVAASMRPERSRIVDPASDGSTSFSCFRKRMAFHFADAFGLRQRLVSSRRVILASAPVVGAPA